MLWDYETASRFKDLDDEPNVRNRIVTPHLPPEWEAKNAYPWKNGESVLYLGEVVGMRGHGIFVGKDGLVKYGYHLDSFKIVPDDQLYPFRKWMCP